MTFEPDSTPPALPFTPSSFDDAMALIRIAGNPKAAQSALDALMASSVKAAEAKAAAERVAKERAAALDEREREIAKHEAAISAEAQEWAARKTVQDNQKDQLLDIYRDIREHGDRFKREILKYSGYADHFNERLQSLPDWTALANMVLGGSDAHYDDGNESTGQPETLDESEPVPNLVADSTLTHRSPRPRAPRVN